ncbi:MAG: tryptophan--tRNA ligase [Candidatus Micrarchaeales archaeon]|jgi:tryptophanyl-tRNA synthetase|uniref:Tryptophan--tRNA ligase n=1 Tax=Candidatus Micrarchaeum acidiphilum ARMAN-2 TaxID=425595 RepID=C7DG29_MICA2|nr:MAG: tryptophanyl-tRNA synthetase [Candidatus Micrarchaeum acidiphilum ARMAN-2]MCW6161087.1 tryptophan--tRNA ligase [Candidatus Micrarchaeales archaeon]
MAEEFHVDAYKVEGKVDYDKFAERFGLTLLDGKTRARLEKLGGSLHFMIKRNIFYAQRELGWMLDEYEKGNRFYIYTGIAPSGSMTVGHLIPFLMTLWLQKAFGAEVYIQIPDEEKFLAKKDPALTLERIHELAYDDALNIIALGFDPKKTKIFFDTEYASVLYKQAVRVAKHITFSTVKDAMGFTNEDNIGKIFYTSMQAVPAFLKSVEEGHNVPCLIPLAIDQDVHFRVARDVITKLGYYKPAILYAKFLPAFDGTSKASASDPTKTIYLSDSHEEVRKKVNKMLTGQQDTAELQKKYGGDPEKCVVCQYFKYLFEPDDKKLEAIFKAERDGTVLAGEHKKALADAINKYLDEHRKKKEALKGKLDSFILRA